MENSRKNIVIIGIIIVVILSIVLGIYLYKDYQNKKYEVEEIVSYLYYPIYENGKMGVIDTKGNIVIEPEYDNVNIPNPGKTVFICLKSDKTIVKNDKKETLFQNYEEVVGIPTKGTLNSIPYEKSVLRYKENDKYGLIDYEGKVITKPIYEEIESLENKEGELLVKKDGKYGVISQKGACIIKNEYDGIIADGYYDEQHKYALSGYIVLLKTEEGYRYGYINYKRKKVLDVNYNDIYRELGIEDHENAYLEITRNGQVGLVKNREIIIKTVYQSIEYDRNNSIFVLQRGSKKGISDTTGKIIVPVEYDQINIKGIRIQAVGNDGITTYFDISGNKLDQINYQTVRKTANENYFITINSDEKYGIVDNTGKVILDNNYRYLEYLYEDYFIASNEQGYLGVINNLGETKVDFKYEVLQKVDNSSVIEAKILKDSTTDVYSSKLEKVYSNKNIFIASFKNYIKIYAPDDIAYFDKKGNALENTQVQDVALYSKKQNGKWGLVDKQGNTIVDCIYDRTTSSNEHGFAGIKKDGKWGVVNEKGNIIVEPKYKIESENSDPEFIGSYYKVYYGYGESYYTKQIVD